MADLDIWNNPLINEHVRLEVAIGEIEHLRAKVADLTVENECLSASCKSASDQLTEALAKIVAAGKQEPVSHQFQDPAGRWHNFVDERHYAETVKDGSWPIRDLFTAPPITTAGWNVVYSAVSAAMEKCKSATGQHGSINLYVNANQITHDALGIDLPTAPRGTEKEE